MFTMHCLEVLVSADVDPALLQGLCQDVQVQGEILPRLTLLATRARFLLRLKPLRHPSRGKEWSGRERSQGVSVSAGDGGSRCQEPALGTILTRGRPSTLG